MRYLEQLPTGRRSPHQYFCIFTRFAKLQVIGAHRERFINTEDVVKNGLVFFEVGDEDIVLKAGSKATISPSQCDLSARPKKKSK